MTLRSVNSDTERPSLVVLRRGLKKNKVFREVKMMEFIEVAIVTENHNESCETMSFESSVI
jgi:hypothetical protein